MLTRVKCITRTALFPDSQMRKRTRSGLHKPPTQARWLAVRECLSTGRRRPPLDTHARPDLSFVERTAEAVARTLCPDQLVGLIGELADQLEPMAGNASLSHVREAHDQVPQASVGNTSTITRVPAPFRPALPTFFRVVVTPTRSRLVKSTTPRLVSQRLHIPHGPCGFPQPQPGPAGSETSRLEAPAVNTERMRCVLPLPQLSHACPASASAILRSASVTFPHLSHWYS